MKTIFLLLCIALASTLFAMGQKDNNSQSPLIMSESWLIPEECFEEDSSCENDLYENDQLGGLRRPVVTGDFIEMDPTSLAPEVVDFIKQTVIDDENDIKIFRLFAQNAGGIKFIVCGMLGNGVLSVWVIHRAPSGKQELLGIYSGENIFGFFADFIKS
jgi:hypothetical protein